FAAKLQAAHGGQYLPGLDVVKRPPDGLVQGQTGQVAKVRHHGGADIAGIGRGIERGGEVGVAVAVEVHVAHPGDGVGPGFAATFTGVVAGVTGNGDVVLQAVAGVADGSRVVGDGGGGGERGGHGVNVAFLGG